MLSSPILLNTTRTLSQQTKSLYAGTDGNDFLFAGLLSFADLTGDPLVVNAGAGNDVIVGGFTTGDALAGDAGDDTIYGDSLISFFSTSTGGNDILYGGAGNDKLYGQGGHDELIGGQGNDALYGGQGNDYLYDDEGKDLLDGGAGNDTYFYDSTSLDSVTVDLGRNVATGVATGTNTLASIENIVSGLGDDVLLGNSEANVIFGNAGADSIDGAAGSDTLVYGAVTDSNVRSFDVVTGFDFGAGGDQFDFQGNVVDSTGVSSLTFSSDLSLASALSVSLRSSIAGGGGLEVNQAQLVSLNGGSITGLYLVVDGNDVAGFQSDGDFVVQLLGATETEGFGLGSFVG